MRSAGCDCANCPFAREGRPFNFVLPTGPSKPVGAFVVGTGPTREEAKNGEVLSNSTGREMSAVFIEAGINRDDLKIIPAWACHGVELKKEAEERAATIACRPLVQQTLAKLPPETPVFLAGKWAQLSVTGQEQGLYSRRGFRDDRFRIGDPLKKDRDKESV